MYRRLSNALLSLPNSVYFGPLNFENKSGKICNFHVTTAMAAIAASGLTYIQVFTLKKLPNDLRYRGEQ